MREQMKPWLALLITLAGAIFGVTVGYSYSQTKLSAIVAVNQRDIVQLQSEDARFEKRMERFENTANQHMTEAVDLFKRQIEAQQRLIEAIERMNQAKP